MTDERTEGELRSHLLGRIPAPAPGYWDNIDSRLAAATPGENAPDSDGDAGHDGSLDTETLAVRPMPMDKPADIETPTSGVPAWLGNRNVLAAAALVVVVGLGIFALTNRSSDGEFDLATASVTEVDPANSLNPADGDVLQPAGTTVPGDGVLPGGGGAFTALQARLAGQVPGAGEEGAGSAGPFCFAADGALNFPGNDLEDRPGVLWFDIAFDGFVNFFALLGEEIVISGSGYPDDTGSLNTQPVFAAGAVGTLPPYIMLIANDTISLDNGATFLDATPCAQVDDRVQLLFRLLERPETGSVSADWPPADAVLSSAGLGPIRIGMTVSELSAELGADIAIDTINEKIAGECGWVLSDAISNSVWIIVELTSPTDAIIRRVSINDGAWATPSGVTLGVSEQFVLDTFPGQIESSPHVYVEGNYLTFQPNNTSDPNTVQFVSESGTITEIRTGERNWVGLVEGCA